MAAPIFDEANRIAASVGIVTTATVLSGAPDPAMTACLQQAAVAISSELRSTHWLLAAPQQSVPSSRTRKGATR
jgi:hypothetical protein